MTNSFLIKQLDQAAAHKHTYTRKSQGRGRGRRFVVACTGRQASQLSAFHARCLRRILDIPHSFNSHIPNSEVLSRLGHSYSVMIKYSRLMLFHKIAQLPSNNVMRTYVFGGGSMNLKEPNGKCSRGRPRKSWGAYIAKYATTMLRDNCGLANVPSLPS